MSNVLRHIDLLRNYDSLSDADRAALRAELSEMNLLTPDHANAKTAKNMGRGFASYILHLAPANVSGVNMCPAASMGCKAACLNTAGRGRFKAIQDSRIRKTLYYLKVKDLFLSQLFKEISKLRVKAAKAGLQAVVRLNGTSDVPWEYIKHADQSPFEAFPDVQFYDYTKVFSRLARLKALALPNYHVTFSRSESNESLALQALMLGFNVAAVFNRIPTEYQGHAVVNGDEHDLRFLDKGDGVIVALKAKGDAKRDASGFVIQLPSVESEAA